MIDELIKKYKGLHGKAITSLSKGKRSAAKDVALLEEVLNDLDRIKKDINHRKGIK